MVSIVKRYAGLAQSFFELISDGNLALMRAVERFDFSLGNRFSTYAARAIVNSFARSIRVGLRWRNRHQTDNAELFAATADGRSDSYAMEAAQSRRAVLLEGSMQQLDEREREVICRAPVSATRENA